MTSEQRFSARFAELAAATSWQRSDEAIVEAHEQARREVYEGAPPVQPLMMSEVVDWDD